MSKANVKRWILYFFVKSIMPETVRKVEAKDVLPNTNRTQAAKMPFLSLWPWPLTFGLDLQTRPSKRPNTPSMWICRSAKTSESRRQKQNLPQFTACGNQRIESSMPLHQRRKLECGPMTNVMAALPNIGGVLCSMPQSLADSHN